MLDENGFSRKTYSDLKDEMEAKAKELFGDNVNLSPRSFLGILIMLFAWFLSQIWSIAEKVYNSRFISKSEGIQLDRKAWEFGIERFQNKEATGQIEIRGTPGHTVEQGRQFETPSGVLFNLYEDVMLDENGYALGQVICTEVGPVGNVPANTITILSSTDADIISVTNPEPLTNGRLRESDADFKARYKQIIPGLGSSNVDAIRAQILQVDGVRAAIVIENNKYVEDDEGRPPKSVSAYVLGGDDQKIAEAIFQKKVGGIEAYGSTQVEVLDLSGNTHTIGFSRAITVPLSIQISIKKNDAFPSNGDEQIKTKLIKYVGGETSDGSFQIGLNMGDDVIYKKLSTAVDSIGGIDDFDLFIGRKGEALGEENIIINRNEVAQLSYADIEVSFV